MDSKIILSCEDTVSVCDVVEIPDVQLAMIGGGVADVTLS
jgi:hypothetical protein